MQVNKPTRHTAIPSSGVSILGFCVLVRCGHVAIVVVVFFVKFTVTTRICIYYVGINYE